MYKFTLFLVAAFIFFVGSTAEVVNYLGCPREEGTPSPNCVIHGVRVTPCATAEEGKPCEVKKGKSLSMEIDYTINAADVTAVEAQAYWTTALADLPLVGMDTDGCKLTTCPVPNGEQKTLTFALNISKKYPARGYDVKFKFWKEEAFECCVITKIKIK